MANNNITMEQLKKSRGYANGSFTRKVNTLKEPMMSSGNVERVKEVIGELREAFNECISNTCMMHIIGI